MKIVKGHYVPKELITSEAVHEAVVKCFVAAGFNDRRPEFGRYIDRNEAFGLVCSDLGNACWTGKAHEKDALTLQQLFTAENGLQWPDWAEHVQCGDDGVFFTSANKGVIQFIAGSHYQAESVVLATRQPKENEVKTIKDAVIELGGKWPKEESDICFGVPVLCECIQQTNLRSVGDIVCCGDEFRTDYFIRICNQQEFESTAKRMGYINGYLWGKEYQTNGKRPDLPDDVLISVKNTYNKNEWLHERAVINTIWCEDNEIKVTAFRVIDPRYKPVDEASENRINERNKMIVNARKYWPPVVGMTVELWHGGQYVEDVEFLCERGGSVIFWRYSNDSVDSAVMPTAELRPIRTHREKVIEAAESGMLTSRISSAQRKTIKRLYDLGMLVLPQDSSDTKD